MTFKLALVTGATSGIGEALAYLLKHKGIPLLLTGRRSDKLAEIGDATQAIETVATDLAKSDGREVILEQIRRHNAGFGLYGEAVELDMQEQLQMLEVNVIAPLVITRESARMMIQNSMKGVILNVSSAAGEFPCPGMSVYGASKSFLTQLSLALHTELEGSGVDVLVSCPGMVETDFANRAAKKSLTQTHGPRLTTLLAAQLIWYPIE
jgi:short-subunit dehydrogenase